MSTKRSPGIIANLSAEEVIKKPECRVKSDDKKMIISVKKEKDEAIDIVYTGTAFHYSGLTTNFMINVWGIGALIFLTFVRYQYLKSFMHVDQSNFIPVIIPVIIGVLLVVGILAPLNWILVFADHSKLTIRRLLLGKAKEIPLSNIKKIMICTQTGLRGNKNIFVSIDLKQGKAFDLFLPKKARSELVAFIKSKIQLT